MQQKNKKDNINNNNKQNSYVFFDFILKPNTPPQIIQLIQHNKKQQSQKYVYLYSFMDLIKSLSDQNLLKFLYWTERYIGDDSSLILQINVRLSRLGKIWEYIGNIKFEKLKCLVLESCQLMNIQALSCIQSSSIIRLSLKNNYLYSLRPLTKTKSPKLTGLNIGDNIFTDNQIKNLTRIHTKNSLTYLYVQKFYEATDKLLKQKQIISNFTQIFKIQSKKIINTIGWLDIRQQKMAKVLQQKLSFQNKKHKVIQLIQPTYFEDQIDQNEDVYPF